MQGAEPLFFLDYVGAGALEPGTMIELVRGVARGCRENGCALLGGETAEMPGFYRPGDYELVGFIVGIADRRRLLDGCRVRAGDALVGLPSAGLHTNGYSLARRILFDRMRLNVGERIPGARSRATVGRLLLAPHLSYLPALRPLLGDPALHAMAHVTGGGLTDNLPRVLPAALAPRSGSGAGGCRRSSAARAPRPGGGDEMLRVFNMGIGMVLIVGAAAAGGGFEARLARGGQRYFLIGQVRAGRRGVDYVAG